MTRLTPQAEQAFNVLREKHRDYRERKAIIEAEVREILEQRLSVIREERDTALRLAADAGVPRTRLGEAIGTSNYKTIQDILSATENKVVKSEGWTLTSMGGNRYQLHINAIGAAKVTGMAEVVIVGNNIDYDSGDQFVVPTIYREGLAEEVIASV
jgi:plasmid stability protein